MEMATESTETTDPNPTPKTFFPFTPHLFVGGGGNTTSGAGLRGSVLSVVSVAIHPGRGVCRDGGAFFLTGTSFPGNAG